MNPCTRTFVLLLAFAMVAAAQTLTPEQFARVDFEQRLGQHVPLNATFRDESGTPVRFGSFFGSRPVILTLAYYQCTNLCTVVLNGLLESARNLRLDAGRDFDVVVVSIKPGESPALAHAKKQTYTMRYGRPGTARGWHFLTGESEAIRQLSDAVGFHYVFDPASNQYAHASGVVVLAPDGTISRYFLGIEYPPAELRVALTDASRGKVGSLVNRLLLLCFHYDPATGKYTLVITRVLQIAGIGTVLALLIWIICLGRRRPPRRDNVLAKIATLSLLPEPASNFAGSVDAIFFSLLAICVFVTVGIFTAVIYFCVRYRAGSRAPRSAPAQTSVKLELSWTIATLLIFVGLFVWAGVVYFRMSRPPVDAIEIQIVAKQWMWKAQHLDGHPELNELHLLVNHPVKLVMTSQDVIHDFFVPAFRTKQDVLPGRYTNEWFTPTKPGVYHLFCSEYCGMDHSKMGGWIYVLNPAQHAAWLAAQPVHESIVASGARLFQARGCAGCHTPNATSHAPLLNGIYQKPVALPDGTTVIADDQYLRDAILLPTKHFGAGYEHKMPVFQGQLGEEEVLQLVAYIKALSDNVGGPP